MSVEEYSEALAEGLIPVVEGLGQVVERLGAALSGLEKVLQIQAGIVLFLGMLFGLLLMIVFWGRFR